MESRLISYILVSVLLAGAAYEAYDWAYNRGSHSRDTEVKNKDDQLAQDRTDIGVFKGVIAQYKQTADTVAQTRSDGQAQQTVLTNQLASVTRKLQTMVSTSKDPCVIAKDVARTYFEALPQAPVGVNK